MTLWLIVSVILLVFACRSSDYPIGDFYVLLIADTHVNNKIERDETLASFIEKINRGVWPGIEMVIHLGDVVSSVYDRYDAKNPSQTVHRLDKADALFKKLDIPYFFVMGNHDYKIDQKRDSDTYFPEHEIIRMEALWKKVTGFDPYFAVLHKGWKFIFLNSMRGRYLHRHFDPDQLDWLEKELEDGCPTILCFHHPLLADNIRIPAESHDLFTPYSEPRFYAILRSQKKYVRGIFVGHGHRWLRDRLFGSIPVYMAASFADSEDMAYYIVGFSNKRSSIDVFQSSSP
jgi:3',5'-cyclic AMP phosphodiesterase CpdA